MTDTLTRANGGWAWRCALHVDYLLPFEPLFRHSAGGTELERQADFIAAQGFADVPAAVDRFASP